MNFYTYNQENDKRYRAAASKPIKKVQPDTSQYNLNKEEVAKNVIRSLKDAQKFLRGEIKGRKARDVVAEMMKYIEENEDEEM